jgi:hypothetical protein
VVPDQTEQKMFERPNCCGKKLGMVVSICHPRYGGMHKLGYCGSSRPGQKQDPISKLIRAKKARSMAQMAECLLCKCETLSSNPNTVPQIKQQQ